ncbi:helix-turn-helix domain-containing protein [Nocardioides sp. J2M5]|uniref:helix-turn-helix domain-containing protein n=1 Tax=Nocardioides palaemonis TaxID=2829810 RepID=UPI001BAC7B24|nr:helix-turn-helix domain-containing protein [Nocardioides palaemonis]MBS2936852.1 helix-turn-helix domain-containing protein [Nocardioides palaemonis]
MTEAAGLLSLLCEMLRHTRIGAGVTLPAMAEHLSVSKGFLSEVERGLKPPSARVVQRYDEILGGEGVLIGLLEDLRVSSARAAASSAPRPEGAAEGVPGDEVTFLDESPDDVELMAGETHEKWWRISNSGSVPWVDRHLRRTGRRSGPEVPGAAASIVIPTVLPGEEVTLRTTLIGAFVPGTRIIRYKMVDSTGQELFPSLPYGLTAQVTSLQS